MNTVYFVSLGCDKNLVDSEVMLGSLDQGGYQIIDQPELANIIVVNTCCFIDDAKKESIDTILEMADYKEDGMCEALIVAGCMAQKYKEEILTEIPEVDAVMGTTAYQDILETLEEIWKGKKVLRIHDVNAKEDNYKRLLTGSKEMAFLKISEGCNKNCTYCMIPQVRGKYRSVPIERLLEHAKDLVKQGVREIVLVAQETTLYGIDLYGVKSLPRLLKELSLIDELEWIRILYAYPEAIDEDLMNTMASLPKVVKYLDMPIQHASDSILKAMGRQTNQTSLRNIIHGLRKKMPEIVLRTTLITGFPGESEEDFKALISFIKDIKFHKLGVFTYSKEENTPAALMPNQIPEELKRSRRDELMEIQQEITFDLLDAWIDQEIPCIIEGKIVDENIYIGRSYGDAPNVDSRVYIHTLENLINGEIKSVYITNRVDYDLIGEI